MLYACVGDDWAFLFVCFVVVVWISVFFSVCDFRHTHTVIIFFLWSSMPSFKTRCRAPRSLNYKCHEGVTTWVPVPSTVPSINEHWNLVEWMNDPINEWINQWSRTSFSALFAISRIFRFSQCSMTHLSARPWLKEICGLCIHMNILTHIFK